MDELFSNENQGSPPSLSDMGKLRLCTKSALIECFDKLATSSEYDPPEVDAKILDGSVIVNLLPPKSCSTFDDYAEKVFLPYIHRNLQSTKRLDVVWDRYVANRLKNSVRQKRGSGNRIIVNSYTPVPKNWQSFLRVDQNKDELYHYLYECISSLSTPGKELCSTQDTGIVSSHQCNIGPGLAPCDHEEADTRIFIRALYCAQKGFHIIVIRSVETDVVLATGTFHALPLEELWIAFGVKKNYRIIPTHTTANCLGPEKTTALLFFHDLSGCDTSSFSSVGKKTACDT